MYSQLLEEAIAKNKVKKKKAKGNAEINLQMDAYLPSDYITDERQKLKFTNVFVRLTVV